MFLKRKAEKGAWKAVEFSKWEKARIINKKIKRKKNKMSRSKRVDGNLVSVRKWC